MVTHVYTFVNSSKYTLKLVLWLYVKDTLIKLSFKKEFKTHRRCPGPRQWLAVVWGLEGEERDVVWAGTEAVLKATIGFYFFKDKGNMNHMNSLWRWNLVQERIHKSREIMKGLRHGWEGWVQGHKCSVSRMRGHGHSASLWIRRDLIGKLMLLNCGVGEDS